MLAIGEKKVAIGCLGDATAEMVSSRGRTVLSIDDLHVLESRCLAEIEARTRKLFETMVRGCTERGWPIYRIHPVFQKLGMEMFGRDSGSLHRLHETLKDAIDPNGIVSPGRYDIWPRRLRETQA